MRQSDQGQLPNARTLLEHLFIQCSSAESDDASSSAKSSANEATGASILKALGPNDRQIWVSIHCMFPYELLPALDLLDRQLVTRLVLAEDDDAGFEEVDIYYVQSTQSKARSAINWYEVRLAAWNCNCLAFNFSVASLGLTRTGASPSVESSFGVDLGTTKPCPPSHTLGGCSLGDDVPPVCKHLLACYLARRCHRLLGQNVNRRVVSKEERAGWAAGWGD